MQTLFNFGNHTPVTVRLTSSSKSAYKLSEPNGFYSLLKRSILTSKDTKPFKCSLHTKKCLDFSRYFITLFKELVMTVINQTVDVNAFFFRGGANGGREIKTYPRQMQFGNREYTFQDGLRHLVRKGQRVFELFDMTDGQTTFRIARLNDEWRLIATKVGV
jgi:hypothetical protein